MISSTLDSGAHCEADGGYLTDGSGTERGGITERRMDGGDVLRRARSTPQRPRIGVEEGRNGSVFFCKVESRNSKASVGLLWESESSDVRSPMVAVAAGGAAGRERERERSGPAGFGLGSERGFLFLWGPTKPGWGWTQVWLRGTGCPKLNFLSPQPTEIGPWCPVA